MNTRMIVLGLVFGIGLAVGAMLPETGKAGTSKPVTAETLLRSDLHGTDGIEVIVSRISVEPNSKLASHYHPGEEFIYVIEGSATTKMKGKPDVLLAEGQAFKIPFEQIHSAWTGDQPVEAVVFRVHRKGEPERIPAE